jgi:hypothetical protein
MIEGQLFQLGYVCDDLEQAVASFRGRGMSHEPRIMEVSQPVTSPQGEVVNHIRLCFVWIGDIQYELIQPIEDPLGVYANAPANGGPMRLHQLCYRVHDWATFRARVDRQDLPVVMERATDGEGVKFLYLDGRSKFGHYLEYTWMSDASWDQIRAM